MAFGIPLRSQQSAVSGVPGVILPAGLQYSHMIGWPQEFSKQFNFVFNTPVSPAGLATLAAGNMMHVPSVGLVELVALASCNFDVKDQK